MELLLDSLRSAWALIMAGDPELFFIVFVSLKVSLSSTIIAGIIGVPAGFLIAFKSFVGKRAVVGGHRRS